MKCGNMFFISAQTIHFGNSFEQPRRGGSNDYPPCMVLISNKEDTKYPCKPNFSLYKVGFTGVYMM